MLYLNEILDQKQDFKKVYNENKLQLNDALSVIGNPVQKYNLYKNRPRTLKELRENNENLKNIDSKMRPLIDLCLRENIPSWGCCEGHPERGYSNGYISFYDMTHPKVQQILSYLCNDIRKQGIHICFNNMSNKGYNKCSVHWPYHETDHKVEQMKDIIKNNNTNLKKQLPKLISWVLKFFDKCGKTNKMGHIQIHTSLSEFSKIMFTLYKYDYVKSFTSETNYEKEITDICYSSKWSGNLNNPGTSKPITNVIKDLDKY